MTWARRGILLASALALMGLAVALCAGGLPLGVRGEWEWPRLTVSLTGHELAFGILGLMAYAGFAAMGMRGMRGDPTRRRQAGWMAGLLVAAVFVQVLIQNAAPEGFGLTKWVALAMPSSSGYHEVAKSRMESPRHFWADYEAWIPSQDELHIGTHPPGLFLLARAVIAITETHPEAARWIDDHLPETVRFGFRAFLRPMSREDRAAIAIQGALSLLLCSATVLPLYVLARCTLSASAAWATAATWPLVPSALMFQPVADTAFPFFAATAMALAARPAMARCLVAGLVLGLGMQFSLVFLPVGLAVGLWIASDAESPPRRRIFAILSVGTGFLGLTLTAWAISRANPFVIWWWNQKHHARFYVKYPRTYRTWIWVNPIEFAIGLGLPATAWCLAGLPKLAKSRASWTALAVLLILNFSGKNLSEVARLWLPFMPLMCVASGAAMQRTEAEAKTLAIALVLLGAETLGLQAAIQVVYPTI